MSLTQAPSAAGGQVVGGPVLMAVPFVNTAQEVAGISRLRDSKGWKLIQTFLESI